MKWAIFYDDGTTFEYEEFTRAIHRERLMSAPTHGVIAIVQKLPDEVRPQMIHQCDFYIWRDDMWWGCDLAGLLDHASIGGSWLKQGRTIRTTKYREILGAASQRVSDWG